MIFQMIGAGGSSFVGIYGVPCKFWIGGISVDQRIKLSFIKKHQFICGLYEINLDFGDSCGFGLKYMVFDDKTLR